MTDLTDAQVLGLTGAAEARAELVPGKGWQPAPFQDLVAVMCTPINRLAAAPARFGADIAAVCVKPRQYSCWNPGSGENHDWLMAQATALRTGLYVAPIVTLAVAAAEKLLLGATPDTVNGATHYYSPASMVPPGRVPSWARGRTPCATVGQQLFFKGV